MPKKYLSALDIGTNSFHLIIVEVLENHHFKIIDREREVIRLASHKGNGLSFITDEEIKNAIRVINKFKKIADKYGTEINAIATSAVRESENKDDFLLKVYGATGVLIKTIEGSEEAELIYKGAEKALALKDKKVLCIDIGGGSTEFIFSKNGEIIFAESIKIGAVRLAKKFFPNFETNPSNLKECEDYITELISSNNKIQFNIDYDLVVGSSGTIQSAARMINFRHQNKEINFINGFKFTKNYFDEVSREIFSHVTPKERLKIKGLEQKRADVIPAGLLILKKAFEIFNIHAIQVSEFALREGIILDLLENENSN